MKHIRTITITLLLLSTASPVLADDFDIVCIPTQYASKKVLSTSDYADQPIDKIMCSMAQDLLQLEEEMGIKLPDVLIIDVSLARQNEPEMHHQPNLSCKKVDSFFDVFYEIDAQDLGKAVQQQDVLRSDIDWSGFQYDFEILDERDFKCSKELHEVFPPDSIGVLEITN